MKDRDVKEVEEIKQNNQPSTADVNVFPTQDTTEATLPSGNIVTYRETTGHDEAILSNVASAKDGSSVSKYLAAIIVESTLPCTVNDVLKWLSRDRNFLLLTSRVFSLGNELNFHHKFDNGHEQDFEENLNNYLWDFSKAVPPKRNEEGFDNRHCQSYPVDNDGLVTHTLASGKIIRFNYLTGLAEKNALGLGEDTLSITSQLVVRKFQLQDNSGIWHPIERFDMFSSREMKEVRGVLDLEDPEFQCLSKVVDPSTGLEEEVSLFTVTDFFFPKG